MQTTIQTLIKYFLTLLTASICCGCFVQYTNVTLTLSAKNFEGKPIKGAVASLDGRSLGLTDEQGNLGIVISLRRNSQIQLKVDFSDDNAYVAPFSKDIQISDADNQAVVIPVTLFLVNKNDATSTAGGTPPSVPAPSQILASKPAAETRSTTSAPDPAISTNKPEHELKVASEIISSIPSNSDPLPEEAKQIIRPNQFSEHVLTLYIRMEQQVVPGASVFLSDFSDHSLKLACKSSLSGRCVVHIDSEKTRSMIPTTIVVKKNGFLTQVADINFSPDSININIQRGQSLDVVATEFVNKKRQGLFGANVLVNDVLSCTTGRSGFCTFALPKNTEFPLHLMVRHPQNAEKITAELSAGSQNLTFLARFSESSAIPLGDSAYLSPAHN